MPDIQIVSKTYKEFTPINNKKTNNSIKKDKSFAKTDIQMANKYMKRWSTYLLFEKCK